MKTIRVNLNLTKTHFIKQGSNWPDVQGDILMCLKNTDPNSLPDLMKRSYFPQGSKLNDTGTLITEKVSQEEFLKLNFKTVWMASPAPDFEYDATKVRLTPDGYFDPLTGKYTQPELILQDTQKKLKLHARMLYYQRECPPFIQPWFHIMSDGFHSTSEFLEYFAKRWQSQNFDPSWDSIAFSLYQILD